MKGRMLVVVLSVVALGALATGCHPDLRTDMARLESENASLKQEVARMEGQLSGSQARLGEKDATIQRLQNTNDALSRQLASANRRIEDLVNQKPVNVGVIPPAEAAKLRMIANEFSDQLEYDEAANIIRVKEAINFASGRSNITAKAKQAVTEVGKVFSAIDGIAFRVTGHTDNDPIKKSAKVNKDNMDLSLKRAHAVWEVLTEAGVAKEKMYCAGFGMIKPMAGSVETQSDAHKKSNRRVEILMVPDTLMK